MKVLYENKDYLVLDKPTGLVVHPDGKNKEPSLVDWVMENYPEMKNVGEPFVLATSHQQLATSPRAGIVHRLDKGTTGVIALAKNQEAYEHLKSQFKNREIKKVYFAFVHGLVKNDEGIIDRPIGRSSKFGLWSAQRGMRGRVREAVTEYKVLEKNGSYSFLEVRPKTGRTHQIRVHLKAINHPVVCDKIYAPKKECALGFERLALHAESLEFRGFDGEEIKVMAPFPKDFVEAEKRLKNVAE